MTQLVDINYIRGALGITGTKESCKGCKYNEPIGFACNTYEAPSFAYVCEVLDDAPIVDAVPVRHGKWIDDGRYDNFFPQHEWRCSECGEHVLEIDAPWYKFCPECGARMDETQKKPCDDCQEFDCYGCEYAERKDE